MLHSGNVGSGSRPLLFPVAAWAAATQGVATHDGDGHTTRSAASALASAAALGAPTHHITCLAIAGGRDDDTSVSNNAGPPNASAAVKTGNAALSDFYTMAAEAEAEAEAGAPAASSVAASVRPSRTPLLFGRGVYGRSMVTGALSGELVHWEQIEDAASASDNAGSISGRNNDTELAPRAGGPVRPLWRPRALLFHSGASSCTALTSATLSTGARVFVAASSEGFLSCWSEGGARCRRSALVLPFAASVLIPLYSFAANAQRPSVSAVGLSPSACLTSSVPARLQPTQSYIVCANLTGASSTVYLVRLPKFVVVAMFEHSAPLLSVEMSHAPYTAGANSSGVGSIGSADSGPFLAVLTVTGVVSLWKLSEYVGAARRTTASTPNRPQYPSRALSGSPGPGPSVSPPPQPRRHVSAGALSKDALDAHTTPASAYASLGAPSYDVPERTLLLPAATLDNLMSDDPALSDASPPVLPSLHPTSCALSKRSRHLLVLAGSHFMLISTQHFHLELPIQSMEVHLKRARALEYQRASSEGQVYSGAIMEWSSSDTLVGCAFMADDVATDKRMVMWSAEGGIFVFLLSHATHAEPTPASDAAAAAMDAAPLDSRFSQPIAVNTLTQNSVVPAKPRLVARLFAMCHLQHAQRGAHDHSSADAEMHPPTMHGHHFSVDSISERREQPDSRATSRAHHDAFLAPPLFVPSTVRVDQQRIVCGNSEGEIYQYFIPRAPANSSSSAVLSALAPASLEYDLDPASGVLHVHPTQVIGVSAAFRDVSCEDPAYPFGVAGSAATSDARESPHSRFLASGGFRARKLSLPLLPSVHRARAPSRSVSLDQLSAVRNASAASNDGTHSPHSARTDSRPTTPSASASASALLSNSALGLHPDASNPCTSSCMLVDPVREQVVLARGFKNGQLQLLNLCGPVHGGLSSAFVVPAGGGPARFETQAHDAALTCMSFASKHSDSKNISVLLITGSVDGDVHTWEMHSARLLHTFHCGSPVLALQQPLNIPTVAALVQAQKVGLLSPSNSDSVATSHVLKGDDPMSGPIAASLDMDVIYQTPSNDLLFIVCADHSIRSAMVQAQSNDVIMAQLQASSNGLSEAARRAYCNQMLQVYRGHRSPVHSVLFNAFTASNDVLLSRDRSGVLYVFSCSSGALEQSVEGDSEVQAILQNYDLVTPGSQLSLMAYQLRQLASFAPGLFQLANEADADMKQEVASKGAAATSSKLHVVAARIAQVQGAMKRLQAGVKRVGHRLTQSHSANTMPLPSTSAVAPLVFGSSSLGSFSDSGVDSSAQQHILCTYLLNRFLFHQQQSGYNASILSGVHHGMAAAGESVVGNNGTAAIVYRPSLLQRGSGGKHVLQTLDLHSTATAANTQRLHSLHLSVYALDVQQLCVELCSRYAALTSSQSNRSGPPDSKRSAQAAWHSLVACLFDWTQGADSVASLLQRYLAFTPPSSQQAFAVFSDRAQGLSVLFPSHTHSLRRWSFDGECTALHLLSLSSVLHTLMASAESAYKPHLQRVLTYYHQQLPRQLPSYQEGDVAYLALYSLHTHDSIHLSARTLLQGVIERASEERRSAWWREWSAPYNASVYTSSSDALLRRNLFSLSLLRREEVSGALAMAASSPSGAASPMSSPPGNARSTSVLARSPTGLGASQSASPPPVSSGGRRGSTIASSPSSNQLSSVPALPEYVADREMMSSFVLCSIFFFEYNAQFASVRQQQFMHAEPAAAASLPTLSFGGSAASFSECASKVPFLVHTLLRMLAWQSHMHENNVSPCELVKMAMACELLARGFSCFRAYIPVESLPLLIRRLQYISLHSMMIEKACNNHAAAAAGAISLSAAAAAAATSLSPSSPLLALHTQLYKSSRRLLLAVGSYHSSLYVFILGKEILLKHVHTLMSVERGHYLLNIMSLLRSHARAAAPALLDAVHTLLKLLHPSHPGLRTALFNSCVDILRELCVLYPQCSFDLDHGRFAIGTTNITYHMVKGVSSTAAKAPMQSGDTHDNHLLMGAAGQVYRPQRSGNPYAVLIFDLKTAGKWRILEGHKADVTAVCFHPNGSHLVSYCARDLSSPTLRVWKLGESGFMSDLLHSHGKCTKQWNLQPIDLTHQLIRDRQARIKDRYLAQQGKAQAAKRADELAAAAAAGTEGPHAHDSSAIIAASSVDPLHAATLPSVSSASQLLASAVPASASAASSSSVSVLPAFASGVAAPAVAAAAPHTLSAAASDVSLPSASPSSVCAPPSLSPLLLPLSSVVSCSEVEEEEMDELTAINERMNKVVKLTWSADHIITLTREDGTKINIPHKI